MHRASAEFIDEIINKLRRRQLTQQVCREQLSRATFTLSTFEQALEEYRITSAPLRSAFWQGFRSRSIRLVSLSFGQARHCGSPRP